MHGESATLILTPDTSAVGAEDATAHPSKIYLGKIWAKLRQNLGKTEEKFGQKWLDLG